MRLNSLASYLGELLWQWIVLIDIESVPELS
jgi:hypothetical protein